MKKNSLTPRTKVLDKAHVTAAVESYLYSLNLIQGNEEVVDVSPLGTLMFSITYKRKEL